MKRNKRTLKPFASWACGLALAAYAAPATAQVAFPTPLGGWDYIYQGDEVKYVPDGEGYGSLDGTWSHDNGSDQWDGSEIGGDFGDGNRPGGAMVISEGDTTYLRIQDTGDPRDYGYSDPGSNRKVYLGHDLTADGATDTVMDDGVTLIIRARIPTSGPLDELHRDGQQANGVQPYPEKGDGYVTSDGGKGNFVIKQAGGGAIAFSLATATDTPGGDPNSQITGFTGLSFNEFSGNAVSGNVNFGQGEGSNVIALDPTQWHEYWISIEKDEANVGTHVARIYVDGSSAPQTFKITAGTGSDFGGSYLAIGSTATPQNSALDIDFFGVKFEAVAPASKSFQLPAGEEWAYGYEGDEANYVADGEGYGSLDGTWSHDNGSDQWDGSGIGGEFGDGNRPGGAMIIEEAGVDYLRIQDTGDPRDYGYSDPGSNRKVYLGHDLANDGASETVLDDGVTLYLRARIPTSGPLDDLHRDGQQANGTQPYPEEGDGYVTSDGGKGNFVIKQAAGGAIAFSLATASDTPGGDPNSQVTGFTGLSFNEFSGNAISGNVNFGQGEGSNVIPFDPTQWHDIWITIEKDETNVGTHVANIYLDGDLNAQKFKITAGTGSDFGGSYLAIGSTATPQNSALDIDFYRVALGVIPPDGKVDGEVDILDFAPLAGASNVSASDGLSFKAVASDDTIPQENVTIVLNGIDRSSELKFEGSNTAWNVSFDLQSNVDYEGLVSVKGASGASIDQLVSFNTFDANNPTLEAENWNFDGGEYINDPDPSYSGDTYFAKGENQDTEGIDFHELSDEFDPANVDPWRFPLGNMPNTVLTNNEGDRAKYQDDPEADFAVNNTQAGEWLNYTRDFDHGESNIYLRASGGTAFEIQLDRVTSDPSRADQSTEKIGIFKSGGIRAGYDWVPLTNDAGHRIVVDLSGKITLRATILSGSPGLNFFMITPPVTPPAPPVEMVNQSSGSLSEPTVVDFGALGMDASYEFHFYAKMDGASTAIAGNNAFAIKLDQWNNQGVFGTTQFGVADNLFEAVGGKSVASVFDRPVHVVIVSDSGAGESRLYVDGDHVGTWGGNFELPGSTKVMGARLEQATDHMGAGSVMYSWATYSGVLTDSEVAAKFAALPDVQVPVAGGITSIGLADGNVVIEFDGTLMSADSVSGPYNAVAGATSPYSVAPDQGAQFFIAQ